MTRRLSGSEASQSNLLRRRSTARFQVLQPHLEPKRAGKGFLEIPGDETWEITDPHPAHPGGLDRQT
jgi:hypothetical protein